jgi:hypothetical protein
MSDLLEGIAVAVVACLLIIMLGVQIQITILGRKIDSILDKLNSNAGK